MYTSWTSGIVYVTGQTGCNGLIYTKLALGLLRDTVQQWPIDLCDLFTCI